MEPPQPDRHPAFGLRDLMGFMAGFALAGALFRHTRPDHGSSALRVAGFTVAYVWFGLVMSGPVVLWLCRLGDRGQIPPRKPQRPGRLLSEVPVGTLPERSYPNRDGDDQVEGDPSDITLNEWLWVVVGGAWIGLTLFQTLTSLEFSAHGSGAFETGAIVINLIPCLIVASRLRRAVQGWTDRVAAIILLAWPVAAGAVWVLDHAR